MTLDNLESTIFVGDKTFKGALQIDANPGAEKVTNGSFTGNATGWTLGAQWAYGTNAVAKSGAGTSTLSQDVSAIADEIYKVVYTTSGISGGAITVSIGGVSGTARTTNDTFTEYITATGTGNLTFTPASATAVTIDDVSVKRVGVAAADRVTAWVGDRIAAGVESAGDAGLFGRSEDGSIWFLGNRWQVPDGLVGTPGVTFLSDDDTGLYRIGANNLGVAVGGAKILDISSAGLKIGATNIITITHNGTDATITTNTGEINLGPATNLAFSDGKNMRFDGGTGTKIGTSTGDKFAFWNATPVVQGLAVADASGGTTVDAEARTAINTLLARMRTYGLIAT